MSVGGLCVVLAAACTAMPTGGPVHAVGAGAAVGAPNINVPVRGPVPADTPRDIVDNFGAANTDYEEAYKVAKEFLADPNAWKPDGSVTVVSKVGETELVQPGNPSKDLTTVTVTDPLVGTIDQSGSFTPAQAASNVSFTYSLKDTSAGWRIVSGFRSSVVLTQDQVNQAYESGYVYFLRPDGQMLVPSRVFLPAANAGALANDLVTNLLNGPPESLAPTAPANTPPSVISAAPADAQLLSKVQITGGVATVNLSADVGTLARTQRDELAAQLTFTLRDPALAPNGVRIQVAGQPLDKSTPVQFASTFSSRDPDAAPHTFYYADELGRTVDAQGDPVAGDAGNGSLALIAPAIAPRVSGSTGQLIAGAVAVTATGNAQAATSETLYAGQPLQLKPLRTGGTFTRPSWDSLLNLWTVEQPAKSAGQQVLEAIVSPNGSTVTTVADPKLASDVILALKVSPDGTRVAVIAKSASTSQLLIGRISTDAANKVTIDQFRAVAGDLTSATDCAWADAETVDVLVNGSTTAGLDSQIWSVDADGWSETQHAAPPGTVSSIAVAPGQPLVIALAGDKTIDEYESTSWVEIGSGTNPAYPG
jgi:spore germination protein GerM